ncbi:hypothetical protein BG844_12050 [Couchioplanes caeruleus subsp. caeruleus]|uniref:Immunity protein 50 of polymorphic toxin system n=1 Tax=Couchioplanes caeruleus subsp. caeruleus TaxID=56427 RepID=A0A1K0FMV7_9ACTN|nr:hypothetical protein BG844_12050 [Couchioplanes caeruleus subsp. caeruleus]
MDLPWRSGRGFRVWRYGVGHSQLLLRSPGDGERPSFHILFEAVEFMKLRRGYPDLVLRLAADDERAEFAELDSLTVPQLHVVLASPERTGFVACSRVTVRRIADPSTDSPDAGEVVLSMSRRTGTA